MKKKTNFTETDIFRTSSLLFRLVYPKVKNMPLDIKHCVGNEFLTEIKRCGQYAKLSYVENKYNKKLKLIYMLYAKREISKAEFDLNLIVSCGLFPGKYKNNETQEIYLNGGSEISKYMGILIIQIDSFISSLETNFNEEELKEIYSNIKVI